MLFTLRLGCRNLLAAALMLAIVNLSRADDAKPVKETKVPIATQSASTKSDKTKADSAAGADDAKDDDAAAEKPRPKKIKKLSPEMSERRDRVRRLLAALRQQPFSTQQNDCSDILEFCRGFGCNTELADNAGPGKKINGITCLCWNMPCAGYEMMTYAEGHLTPRIGYGYQGQPSEMAAVLALSEVPADYPARVGRVVRTVADIVEYEKLTCRAGTDMSLKLVALSHYVREPSWKDSLGEDWTLQRVIAEELNRPVGSNPHGATNRLLGLACAVNRFKADKANIDGEVSRAASYVEDATKYAYGAQNTDGSWGRASNRDYATAVSYTAHMLEWLLAALPAASLEDHRIAGGIDFLTTSFNAQHYQNYISTMSPREVSAAMHAAYVLNCYDQVVFAPADPATEPAKSEKPVQKAAERETRSR